MHTRTDLPFVPPFVRRINLAPEWQLAIGLVLFFELMLLLIGTFFLSVPHCDFLAQGTIERLLLRPWLRYDTCQYIQIAARGYGATPGSTAFHPLYILCMSIVGRLLGGQYLLGGWLVSALCCTVMLALFYRLVLLDYEQQVAQRSVIFLMASPLGFSFLIAYTEALLMLCIVGALYAARRGRWWLAGLAGFGAALTKQPGVIVLLPLLWELWQQGAVSRKSQSVGSWARSMLHELSGLVLVPLGLLVFILFRASLGDVAFSWSNPVSLVDALLVSPQFKQVWEEYFSWPWVNFLLALEVIATRPYFYIVLNTALMLVAVLIIAAGIRYWRGSYRIYSVAVTLLNLSIVYPNWPYMGIVRRFTIIFPIFIQLGVWGRRPPARWLILCACGGLWLLITLAYLRKAFVP